MTSILEGFHLDNTACWMFLYGLGASVYFRRSRLWLLWVGTSMQALNIVLYSSGFLSKHSEQIIAASVLGCYLFAFLLFAHRRVQKGLSMKNQSLLSWKSVGAMVEWRLAEEFRRQGMEDAEIRTWIRHQLTRSPSMEQGEEEYYRRLRSKMNLLEQNANWRSEMAPIIERDEEILNELCCVRRQMVAVGIWVMVGTVLLLLGRH